MTDGIIYKTCISEVNLDTQLNNFPIFQIQNNNLTLEQYKKYLENKTIVNYCQITAELKTTSNNKLIGILCIEDQPSFPHYADYMYISSVFVLPEYRHLGIGSKLVEEVLTYIKQIGRPAYLTTITTKDKTINQYYIDRGFKLGGDWLYVEP